NGLRKLTHDDEIRDDVNLPNRFGIERKQRITQTRFFFPKRALNIDKNLPAPNFRSVRQRRCARVRIHGRAVGGDEKSGTIIRIHRTRKRPVACPERKSNGFDAQLQETWRQGGSMPPTANSYLSTTGFFDSSKIFSKRG